MKIGELVRAVAPGILASCAAEPAELTRLQDARYSKRALDINFPFCLPVSRITPDLHARFYAQEHEVRGLRVRVTSQWFNPPTRESLFRLHRHLKRRGVPTPSAAEAAAAQAPRHRRGPSDAPERDRERPRSGRCKGSAIGNAQNALLCNLLSRIGEESFGPEVWETVISDFDRARACCGATGTLVTDHAVPINKTDLGERRLGSLVPACGARSARKAGRRLKEFIGHDPAASPGSRPTWPPRATPRSGSGRSSRA